MTSHSGTPAELIEVARDLLTGVRTDPDGVGVVEAARVGIALFDHLTAESAARSEFVDVVDLMRFAVDRAPEHGEIGLWWCCLAMAHWCLATSDEERDVALECAHRASSVWLPDDESVDSILVEIASIHVLWTMDREVTPRGGPAERAREVGALVDRVVSEDAREQVRLQQVYLLLRAWDDTADQEVLDRAGQALAVVRAEDGEARRLRVLLQMGLVATSEDTAVLDRAADELHRHATAHAAAGELPEAEWITWVLADTGRAEDRGRALECLAWSLPAFEGDPLEALHAHVVRLHCLLNSDRPVAEVFPEHPVREWLLAAEDAIRVADDADPELAARCSGLAAVAWWMTLSRIEDPTTLAGHPVVEQHVLPLIAAARRVGGMDALFTETVDMVEEQVRNVSKIAAGRADLKLDRTLELLTRPDQADLHDFVRTTSSWEAAIAGEAHDDRAARRLGDILMSGTVKGEAMGKLLTLVRAVDRGERVDESDIEDVARRVSRTAPQLREPLLALFRASMGERPSVGDEWHGRLLRPALIVNEVTAAARRWDVAAVREICGRLDDLAATTPDHPVEQRMALAARVYAADALALMDPGDADARDKAITLLSRFVDLLREHRDIRTHSFVLRLADRLRRRDGPGDREHSRRLGLEALGWRGYQVLLQSSTTDAVDVAREQAGRGDPLLDWCLEDGALEDLVRVLEARRSLVLKAATTGRDVARQLTAAGRADLAAEWREKEGQDRLYLQDLDSDVTWGELRRRVLTALVAVGDHGPDPLAGTPSVAGIRAALVADGTDAVVYLLPESDSGPGKAVVVPACGEVRVLGLPLLKDASAPAFRQYAEAYAALPPPGTPKEEAARLRDRWRAALAEVCGWAWNAAARDLLPVLRGLAPGRLPAVVLVPVGRLGLIPWHAARRPDGERHRHLLEDVVLSYAPAAAVWRDAVRRPAVTGGRAVLVGNPRFDLQYGGYEASAVKEAYYREEGLFFGSTSGPRRRNVTGVGAGTPEEVLDALSAPLGLLHLACHAVADLSTPLDSAIRLAGADLTVREVLDRMPTEYASVEQVTLAACTTNVTRVDYDEALTLSTAFLALGARTVVGSMWEVPAGLPTVQLMFVMYRGIRKEGLRPAEALRRAQLWMLDPDRVEPEELPSVLSAARAPAPSDNAELACWAGFLHLGR
ncbi:CHAT domain-containing protein [Actinosynnema sp. NPDC020468]|uniref:CHAT domain-containing protein n=1 Tax=Actinosynnema sp. NPDC020468 TaxID=3154488 RepID=UPI0033F4AE4A